MLGNIFFLHSNLSQDTFLSFVNSTNSMDFLNDFEFNKEATRVQNRDKKNIHILSFHTKIMAFVHLFLIFGLFIII